MIISNEFITRHAKKRIQTRMVGIITLQEIMDRVDRYRPDLAKMHAYDQVHIVMKKLDKVCHINGSSGNLVVACVDPRTVTVKTVMLRYDWQMGTKKA